MLQAALFLTSAACSSPTRTAQESATNAAPPVVEVPGRTSSQTVQAHSARRIAGIPARSATDSPTTLGEDALLTLRTLPTTGFRVHDTTGALLRASFSMTAARLVLPDGVYFAEAVRIDSTGAIVGIDALSEAAARSCDIECHVLAGDDDFRAVEIIARGTGCADAYLLRATLLPSEGRKVIEFRAACDGDEGVKRQ
jgi:hypothetical protein